MQQVKHLIEGQPDPEGLPTVTWSLTLSNGNIYLNYDKGTGRRKEHFICIYPDNTVGTWFSTFDDNFKAHICKDMGEWYGGWSDE
jgi:hypothetical protein